LRENDMSRTSRNLILLLAVVLSLTGRGLAATVLGSVTITGAEQFSGSTWDSGTVTATINGVSVSFTYSQYSTPASIASTLGALISQKCSMAVYAHAVGNNLTLYQKGTNVLSSATIASTSNNPSLFPNASFLIGGVVSISLPQITGISFDNLDNPIPAGNIASSLSGPPHVGFIILGNNFGPNDNDVNTYVTLNGQLLNTTSWSNNAIWVQVPPNFSIGGPYSLVVTVAGLSSTSGATFQVATPIACP
jgi:hypothetical protein